jgi:hypothetical protein
MPPKKTKGSKKKAPRVSDDDALPQIDVQYNPDIVSGLLQELEKQLELKCNQLQKDSDFMVTSIQQAFHLELIKLPNQVKQMSLSRFKEEFGDSLEAVTRGAIGGISKTSSTKPVPGSVAKAPRSSMCVFQTPASNKNGSHDALSVRNPREGERILSENGSPLGAFNTVVKAPKSNSIIPQTPGVFVPLETGDVLDIESVDVETMPEDMRQDALVKMQAMMDNIQSLMQKLKK